MFFCIFVSVKPYSFTMDMAPLKKLWLQALLVVVTGLTFNASALADETHGNPPWVEKAYDFALAAKLYLAESESQIDTDLKAPDLKAIDSSDAQRIAAHKSVGLLISMNETEYKKIKSEVLNDLYDQTEFAPLLELLDAFDLISENQDYDAALQALDKVQKTYDLSPDDQVIHDMFVAYTLADQRDYAEALRYLSNAIRFKDELSPMIAYQLLHAEIFMFERVDDFDRSLDRSFEILEFTKQNNIDLNPQTLVNKYANSLRRNKFFSQAASVNEIAREISLETQNEFYIFLSHYVCGMIASDQGQNDRAISCFETAFPLRHKLRSRNMDFLVHYSKALERAGHVDYAKELLSTAKADPSYEDYVKIHLDVSRIEADLLFREGRAVEAYKALSEHHDNYIETESKKRAKATEELKAFTDKEAAWLKDKADTFAAKEALQRRVISRQKTLILLTALLFLGLFGFAFWQRISTEKIREARKKALAANDAMKREARTDQLTRIGNRRAFYEYCETLATDAKYKMVTLAILDLDGFKQINDSYGHDAGDILIQATGQKFDAALNGKGRVFRLGGDEFAILFFAPDSSDLRAFKACVLEAVRGSVKTDKKHLDIICSVGAVRVLAERLAFEVPLKQADYALYEAKKKNGVSFHIFSEADSEKLDRENKLAQEVIWNLENSRFHMFGQVIMQETEDGFIPFGVEGLIRAQTRSGDVIKPESFVQHAISASKADLLTELTLRKSIDMIRTAKLDCPLLYNMSREQINGFGAYETIIQTLESMNFPADQLIVELSEFTQNHDLYRASDILKKFKANGIRIAIDDFGSGNTGLATLLEFEFDLIKTDQLMLRSAMQHSRTKLLMSKLIELTDDLKIPCIIEGVESLEDLSFANDLGGQFIQGYLLGRPEEVPRFRLDQVSQYRASPDKKRTHSLLKNSSA